MNAQVLEEKEPCSAIDMLMHRSTCGWAVNVQHEELPKDSHVLNASDITTGIQNEEELKFYMEQALSCSAMGYFAPADNAEILKPVAAYCKGRELTFAEVMYAGKLRGDKRMVDGPSDEDKEDIDLAIYAFAKKPENEGRLPVIKSLLSLGNAADILCAKSDDMIGSAMSKMTFSMVMSSAKGRQDIAEAYFNDCARRYAAKYENK